MAIDDVDARQPAAQPAGLILLRGLLQEIGLPCHPAGASGALVIACKVKSTILEGALIWHDVPGLLEVDLLFPFLVPTKAASIVPEAVAHANMALRAVRLDYDAPNRRLLLRAFHVTGDQPLVRSQLEFYLQAGLLAAELLYMPLQDVCFRGARPASIVDALRQADVREVLISGTR
jgi:hypothetical protein